jgi:hypothetical protein
LTQFFDFAPDLSDLTFNPVETLVDLVETLVDTTDA